MIEDTILKLNGNDNKITIPSKIIQRRLVRIWSNFTTIEGIVCNIVRTHIYYLYVDIWKYNSNFLSSDLSKNTFFLRFFFVAVDMQFQSFDKQKGFMITTVRFISQNIFWRWFNFNFGISCHHTSLFHEAYATRQLTDVEKLQNPANTASHTCCRGVALKAETLGNSSSTKLAKAKYHFRAFNHSMNHAVQTYFTTTVRKQNKIDLQSYTHLYDLFIFPNKLSVIWTIICSCSLLLLFWRFV